MELLTQRRRITVLSGDLVRGREERYPWIGTHRLLAKVVAERDGYRDELRLASSAAGNANPSSRQGNVCCRKQSDLFEPAIGIETDKHHPAPFP
jgi:hypothetical protein